MGCSLSCDNSGESPVDVTGAAQRPRSRPWKTNTDGPRTVEQAVEIARSWGVVLPEDVELVLDEWGLIAEPEIDARYFRWRGELTDVIPWSAFYARSGRITLLLKKHVLESDEAIIAVLAHEIYELNNLRALFAAGNGTMVAQRLFQLVEAGIPRNLHDQAWDIADRLVDKMRSRS